MIAPVSDPLPLKEESGADELGHEVRGCIAAIAPERIVLRCISVVSDRLDHDETGWLSGGERQYWRWLADWRRTRVTMLDEPSEGLRPFHIKPLTL